jgi:hypothetical protein
MLTCRIDINIAMHSLQDFYCYVIVTWAAYPIDAPEGEKKALFKASFVVELNPQLGKAPYPYV